MKTRPYAWMAAAALGFTAGFVARKGGSGQAPPVAPARASASTPGHAPATPGEPDSPAQACIPLPVSRDSIEDLLALENPELYGRLGLWLLDASEEDMAAFWTAYRTRDDADFWTKDLIFTQWAKKNPQGLLQAAKRDGEEGPAWWAWTMSDPDGALAAVDGESQQMRGWVLRGIANFHPQQALAMLEEKPQLAGSLDLTTLARELGRDDPRAAVEFLAKHSHHDLSKQLKEWGEKDPHEAFRWLQERGDDEQLRGEFIRKIAKEHPGALAEISAGLSPGSMKREVETAIFQQLVESSPGKALAEAKKAGSPVLVAQRLAQLGTRLASDDPDQAFTTLGDLLAACPDAPHRMSFTRYPNGGSGEGGGVPGVADFIKHLARAEPARTMESILESEGGQASWTPGLHGSPHQVAAIWAAQDSDGFIQWCEQGGEKTADFGAAVLTNQLIQQQDFEGALAWIDRIRDPQHKRNHLGNVISNWRSRDPAAAEEWYRQADLPEEMKQVLQSYFPSPAP